MKGKFYIQLSDSNKNRVEYSLHDDTSLMDACNLGNYELLLGSGYHISIGIDKEKGECVSIFCLLDALSFESKTINIFPEGTQQYDLMYVSANSYQGDGEHYIPFERKYYYDDTKSILAFGNIYDEGKIISFNNNSFAKLKDNELLAVFIKVPDEVIVYLKNKEGKKHKFINWGLRSKR